MKKTFPLIIENQKTDRLSASARRDIKKYLRRESNKKLPDGFDFWIFNCRFGSCLEEAEPVKVSEINPGIDQAIKDEWESFYLEILTSPGKREAKNNRPSADPANQSRPDIPVGPSVWSNLKKKLPDQASKEVEKTKQPSRKSKKPKHSKRKGRPKYMKQSREGLIQHTEETKDL